MRSRRPTSTWATTRIPRFADSIETAPVSSAATVPVVQSPALKVTKTATSAGPYDSVGDVVTYSISVKNTGNLTLTGVTVTDPGVGVVLGTCTPATPATLAPGASVVCAANHTMSQADIDAGTYTNTAVGDSDQTAPTSDDETVPAAQSAHITLEKSAVETKFARVADVIDYTLVATNDGNVTLTNVTIVDPKLGTLTCTPPQPATLAPGAPLSCTGSHTITQADLDAGVVTNVATATGTPPSGPNVSDTDDASVPSAQAPHISLVKSAAETSVDRGRRPDPLLPGRDQRREPDVDQRHDLGSQVGFARLYAAGDAGPRRIFVVHGHSHGDAGGS